MEIYFDGYGWIPYEMTPPAEDEDLGYIGFAEFFARLFSPTERNVMSSGSLNIADASDIASKRSGRFIKIFGSIDYLLIPLIVVMGITGAVIVFIYGFSGVKRLILLRRLLKAGDYDGALLLEYRDMVLQFKKRGLIFKDHPLVSEVSYISDRFKTEETGEIFTTVQKAAFSGARIDHETYIDVREQIKKLTANVIKQLKNQRKMR